MSIPILTYHSMNITNNTYSGNDHVALAADLQMIGDLGFRVISLRQLVDWHTGYLSDDQMINSLVITMDDGAWFDYYDLVHPVCGMQRSMFNIIRDFNKTVSTNKRVQATSFVIASPEARLSLDKSCMVGQGWWNDQWWSDSVASEIMNIECHSWDHVHPMLEHVSQCNQVKGDFRFINNYSDADVQFAKAGQYIGQILGRRPDFFAYPYGEVSDYVVNQYLPTCVSEHGYLAAFTTQAKAVTKEDNIWALPRYVCGRDWNSKDGLRELLISCLE